MKKLNGYVLIESVFAMVVVMTCFGLGMIMINTVMTGSHEQLRLESVIAMQSEATRIRQENALLDDVIKTERFIIEKKILPYKNSVSVKEIRMIAFSPDGKQIGEYHELICIP